MHFNLRLLVGSSLTILLVIGLSACAVQKSSDVDPDWIDLENYDPTYDDITAVWNDFRKFGTYYYENRPLLYYKNSQLIDGIETESKQDVQSSLNNTVRALVGTRDYEYLAQVDPLVDDADQYLTQLGLSRKASLEIPQDDLPYATKTQIAWEESEYYDRSYDSPYLPVSRLFINSGSDDFREDLKGALDNIESEFLIAVRLDVGSLLPRWSSDSKQQILPLGKNNIYTLQRCNMHNYHVVHSIGFSGVLVDREGYVVRAGFEGFYIDDRILRYNKKDDFCSAPGDSIDIFGTLTGMDVDERTYFLIDQQKFNEQLSRGELDEAWKTALETLVTTLINGYDGPSWKE